MSTPTNQQPRGAKADASRQLIRLIAQRLVREALAEAQQQPQAQKAA